MPAECERCGRPAPASGSGDLVPWEARVLQDGSVAVICPDCLAGVNSAAIDEGRMWSELEQLAPEDLVPRPPGPSAAT